MNTLSPRIYVACLDAYNNGFLHGEWIDATQGIDGIWDDINAMLAASPMPGAEEWAIHDYEDFGSLRLSEYTGLNEVVEIAEFLEEHGELGAELIAYFGGSVEDARTALEDNYHGEYDSEADYAQSFAEECYEIPDHLRFYIDYGRMARDIFINDCFSIELRGKVHVFTNF